MTSTCLACKNVFEAKAQHLVKNGDQFDYYSCPACGKPVRLAATPPPAAASSPSVVAPPPAPLVKMSDPFDYFLCPACSISLRLMGMIGLADLNAPAYTPYPPPAHFMKRGDPFDLYSCPACGKNMRLATPGSAAPPPTPLVPGWLVIKNGPHAPAQRLPLQIGKNTVGRYSMEKPADVRIETTDTAMSRRHCQVEVVRDERRGHYDFWVRDSDSPNGTYHQSGGPPNLLNERDIVQLKAGESLLLGKTKVLLEINPSATFTPVAPSGTGGDPTLVKK